jgi:hypothetical protein
LVVDLVGFQVHEAEAATVARTDAHRILHDRVHVRPEELHVQGSARTRHVARGGVHHHLPGAIRRTLDPKQLLPSQGAGQRLQVQRLDAAVDELLR